MHAWPNPQPSPIPERSSQAEGKETRRDESTRDQRRLEQATSSGKKIVAHRQDRLHIPLSLDEALGKESEVRAAHLDEVSNGDDGEHEGELEPFDDVAIEREPKDRGVSAWWEADWTTLQEEGGRKKGRTRKRSETGSPSRTFWRRLEDESKD